MLVLASGVDLGNVVDVLGVVFGLIVVVASAVAVARTSVFKAQVEGLRGDRDDLQARVDRVEEDNAALMVRAETAEARVKVLESVVTAREELASISSLLQAHDRKADRKADEIIRAVQGAAS